MDTHFDRISVEVEVEIPAELETVGELRRDVLRHTIRARDRIAAAASIPVECVTIRLDRPDTRS